MHAGLQSHRTLQEVAFPLLDESQIAAIAKLACGARYGDGHVLYHVGAPDFRFFVIKSGRVEILEVSGGQARTVTVHEAGGFTGDIQHLTGGASVVTAVCRGDCEVYEVSDANLHRILTESPRLSDLILQAFIARRQLMEDSPEFVGYRVIGSRYSRDTHRLRDFFARNHLPHTFLDLESNPEVTELLRRFGTGPEDTPVVACGEMLVARNPTNREIADHLGVRQPVGTQVYDLIIVGGGPAGLAAALYAASEGLQTLVLEREAAGGQAAASMRIENYLGFPTGITGSELTERAVLQAQKFGARLSIPTPAARLELDDTYPVVTLDGDSVTGRALLIATGADYRKLTAEGLEQFEGTGVYYAATATEAQGCYAAPVVVVVGGGNSAGQAAVFLAEQAKRVLLLIRGDDLYKNMSSYLARRIEHTDNIEVRRHTEIRRMMGDGHLSQAELVDNCTGQTQTVDTPAVFTFIGAVPRTDWLGGQIETDARGFIRTGLPSSELSRWPLGRPPLPLETSHPGIFAAGDVRLGSTKRVASAVGEGAMAVQLVHEYLSQL